ncbi:serpin B3 isoform X2 [Biomphalaria glabrata]|nr:serpin B3 isoform X2 [Biomphalaria glabrata]
MMLKEYQLRSTKTRMLSITIVLVFFGQLVTASEDDKALISTLSEFSQRLYYVIGRKEANIVFSPHSVHSLLTLASKGAREPTAEVMKEALGITSLGDSVHSTYQDISREVRYPDSVQLGLGNGIFVKPGFTIDENFDQDAQSYYAAAVENINLGYPGGPEIPINEYIAMETQNNIQDLLSQGTINDNTRMLLVSVLLFRGSWKQQFDREETVQQTFHTDISATKVLDMMHDARTMRIKRDDDNQVDVGELCFEGDTYCLYIAIPQRIVTFMSLENSLAQPYRVSSLFEGLNDVYVELVVPKFKIETQLNLKSALTELGFGDIFDEDSADFSGIGSSDLYINDVIHKAVFEVTEDGTFGTAATVADGSGKSLSTSPPLERFIVDRPFIYFLRNKNTGHILLQGKFSG